MGRERDAAAAAALSSSTPDLHVDREGLTAVRGCSGEGKRKGHREPLSLAATLAGHHHSPFSLLATTRCAPLLVFLNNITRNMNSQ